MTFVVVRCNPARNSLFVTAASRVVIDLLLHKKVKQSRNRPGVAQRFPGGLGSQISMTFST